MNPCIVSKKESNPFINKTFRYVNVSNLKQNMNFVWASCSSYIDSADFQKLALPVKNTNKKNEQFWGRI